jgi:hypothetical protein
MINSGLRIGRHYGGGKDILVGLAQAMNEPASAFQAFAGNPRRYWASKTSEEVRDAFKARSLLLHHQHRREPGRAGLGHDLPLARQPARVG